MRRWAAWVFGQRAGSTPPSPPAPPALPGTKNPARGVWCRCCRLRHRRHEDLQLKSVIPAKAGLQFFRCAIYGKTLDAGFRRHDNAGKAPPSVIPDVCNREAFANEANAPKVHPSPSFPTSLIGNPSFCCLYPGQEKRKMDSRLLPAGMTEGGEGAGMTEGKRESKLLLRCEETGVGYGAVSSAGDSDAAGMTVSPVSVSEDSAGVVAVVPPGAVRPVD